MPLYLFKIITQMENLRDKSKRLLKQTQTDTKHIMVEMVLNNMNSKDATEKLQTIIDIYLLELSDEIVRITTKLETLANSRGIDKEVKSKLTDVISLMK